MRHLFTLLLLAICAFADAQQIDTQKIDAYLNHIEAYDQGIGSVSVFQRGKEIYRRDFGQQAIPDLKRDSGTKYQVGSITKVFTSVLIWKLIEDQKLSLDTKLAEFFPKFPSADKIAIEQLLNHTSGIKDFTRKSDSIKWLSVRVPKQEILDEIHRQGLRFEPGTGVRYSNSAFYLLKEIVEKKYQSNFGKIVSKHIVIPNDLGDLASADLDPTNIFEPYQYRDKVWNHMQEYEYHNTVGVGDISATPQQLNRFLYKLFHGKILKSETVTRMIPAENEEWGRNLMPIPFKGRMLYGHAGDTYGSHSIAAYDRDGDINLSICLNGKRMPQNDLYVGILDAMYSQDPVLPFFVKTADLERYKGEFESGDRSLQLEFYVHETGVLMCLDVKAEIAFPMSPSQTDKFFFKPLGIDLEFDNGKILFEQNGVKLTLEKVG